MFPSFAPVRTAAPKKHKRILIDIATLHNEIDTATYRKGDARYQSNDPRFKNAIQSDATEGLDGMVLRRLTDWRDAKIRRRLSFCLEPANLYCSDNVAKYNGKYIYALKLSSAFNDTLIPVGAALIDEYIVKGALVDWYDEAGTDDGNTYRGDLQRLEDDIVALFRDSVCRVPLQPFGPAEKVYGDDFFYKPFASPTHRIDREEQRPPFHHDDEWNTSGGGGEGEYTGDIIGTFDDSNIPTI